MFFRVPQHSTSSLKTEARRTKRKENGVTLILIHENNCHMKVQKIALFAISALSLSALPLIASEIQFEGYAPSGGLTNVSPGFPYTEAGFTLTPTDFNSAVFDAAYGGATFPGDTTSWFGFSADNLITMTGPSSFNLASLDIGPSSLGSGNINATITADLFGGGTLSATFTGLTTDTTETLNWTGLTDVTISVTSDAGLDNISTDIVNGPEPGTLLMLAIGLATLGARRWRRA
jgi:hypothetical protein